MFVIFVKNCRLDTILSQRQQTHGSISGQTLVDKLKAGDAGSKADITFLTKVLGRYLMNNCAQ